MAARDPDSPSAHRRTASLREMRGALYPYDFRDGPLSRSESVEMRTPDQTLDEILDLASAHFKVSREELSPDDDFFKKLAINSLQALELLTRLETHFNVELPDYEIQGVTDFRTLAARIQSRL